MSVLEGVNLYAYGHSYLSKDYNGCLPGQRYVNRVGRRLGMTVVNRAFPGNRMVDAACAAIGTLPGAYALGGNPSTWRPGTPGVVVIDCTTNDTWSNYTSQGQRAYEHSLRSLLHFLSLKAKADEDSKLITRVGGAIGSHADSSNGHNWRLSSGANGSASLSNYTMPAGTSGLLLGAWALAGVGRVFEVLLDGQVVSTVDTGSKVGSARQVGRAATPMVVPMKGLAAGSRHTVAIRPTVPTGSGPGPFLDYIGVLSATPPRIVVMTGVYSGDAAKNAAFDAFNGILTTVCAELPNVTVCDARPGWVPATMIGSDGTHPTARGHAHLADALEQTLTAAVPDFTPGVTA